jgi:hypothetical protein
MRKEREILTAICPHDTMALFFDPNFTLPFLEVRNIVTMQYLSY